MKTALKIGFSTTTQHWKSTLLQSKFLIFTFILAALLESFLLHEVSQIVDLMGLRNNYYDSRSILAVDLLDLSDKEGSLTSYLLTLTRSHFYDFVLLNSFFLGVYYHKVGFPNQEETNSNPNLDAILDTPIEANSKPTLSIVLQHTEKENRVYYFKILMLLIFLELLAGVVGNLLYSVLSILGYVYYWLLGLLPYSLLLLLYLNWLDIPFSKFWENQHKWLLIIVCGVLIPLFGGYLSGMIHSMLNVVGYAISGLGLIEMNNLLRFLGYIAYLMLVVPFISIFYSQTLIYFKNEEEA